MLFYISRFLSALLPITLANVGDAGGGGSGEGGGGNGPSRGGGVEGWGPSTAPGAGLSKVFTTLYLIVYLVTRATML